MRPFDGATLGEPVLDIADDVVTDVEQGLLDIEFSPDGGVLYLHYSVQPDGDTRVVSYAMSGDTVDTGSWRELLAVEQPYPNHNGGSIEFGPDGYLYVGARRRRQRRRPRGQRAGHRGAARQDPAHRPRRRRPATRTPSHPTTRSPTGRRARPRCGCTASATRGASRSTAETGDLWVADVGQNAYEEIDLLPAADGGGRGANLGWNEMEATHPFEGGSNPDGAVLPVFEYDRSEGACSVTGGVVYRGAAIPGLDGAYLFTDFCDGRIRAVRAAGGQTVDQRTFDASGGDLVSFGTDAAGEVYVLSLEGPIYRLDPA